MKTVLDTLFLALSNGGVPLPAAPERVLFLNAQMHPMISTLNTTSSHMQQFFKPYADRLSYQGFSVDNTQTLDENSFTLALVMAPKNMIEARFLIAQALQSLQLGGVLVCAADNKAGGTRLAKMLAGFGLDPVQTLSKNKARVCWARLEAVDEDAVQSALEAGAMQSVLDGRFVSQPGIFGWDKIDKGSALLVDHLPESLRGAGADFGCGYGFLSDHALAHCAGIEKITCLDADQRALIAAQQNLKDHGERSDFIWADLTDKVPLQGLDFILMNPPFHEGKKTDSDIGVSFIEQAFKSLKAGGDLWMVANIQLPYESLLSARFSQMHKIHESHGFKIFHAVK